MHVQNHLRNTCITAISLAMFTTLGLSAVAQQASVQGLVIGRSGPSMSLKTGDTPRLTVLLSDSTEATAKGGFLGMGRDHLGIKALVPGLYVKVDGSYNSDHQLIAKKIVFSKSSLNTARQIDAGLNPVNEQLGQQQDQLASNKRDINQSQQDITKSQQDISTTQAGLATTTAATATNTEGVAHATTRIGSLDQFDTKDTLTVNFANGRSTVTKKDQDALNDFVKAAADTPGFMIEVQGYASTVGSAAANQRLSAERADAVLAIIQQSGVVPMTRILAPAAMGISNQVDTDHTRKAQAQNRRVVITIVVNKGITG
jgi:outer membrane protein OmpA-like peptidoglycan-associated protein